MSTTATIKDRAARSIKRAKESHKPFKYQLAAEGILHDCLDRRGVKREFEQIERSVLDEIIETWSEIIKQVVEE